MRTATVGKIQKYEICREKARRIRCLGTPYGSQIRMAASREQTDPVLSTRQDQKRASGPPDATCASEQRRGENLVVGMRADPENRFGTLQLWRIHAAPTHLAVCGCRYGQEKHKDNCETH